MPEIDHSVDVSYKELPKFIEAEWEAKYPTLKAVQLLPGEANAMAFSQHISTTLDLEVVEFTYRMNSQQNKKLGRTFAKCHLGIVFSNGRAVDMEDGEWLVFKGDGTTQVLPNAALSYDYNKKD